MAVGAIVGAAGGGVLALIMVLAGAVALMRYYKSRRPKVPTLVDNATFNTGGGLDRASALQMAPQMAGV